MKARAMYTRINKQLDEKLFNLCEQTGRTRAEILRALLAKATLNDLPRSWTDPEEAKILTLAER
jgi:predicted DNA-binding protein